MTRVESDQIKIKIPSQVKPTVTYKLIYLLLWCTNPSINCLF